MFLWKYYAFAVVGTSRYLLRQKRSISTTNEKVTLVGKPLLNKDLNGVPREYEWGYRGAIGMLTYLTGSV